MKIGIILLARTGSTRLPGKVLLKICGKTVVEHIIRRLERVYPYNKLIVATTVNKNDDQIEVLCDNLDVDVFRGSEENVLGRCIDAAEFFGLDIVIRIGADAPFIDWEIINDMLCVFLTEREKGNYLEYLSNSLERSFPLGLDADIFDVKTLVKIDKQTRECTPEERRLNEINVIPYLHQNRGSFRVFSYKKSTDYSYLRWTLDTIEDFKLISKIYEALYHKKQDFVMRDILEVLNKHPEWSQINADIMPTSGYWTETEKAKLKQRLEGGVLR